MEGACMGAVTPKTDCPHVSNVSEARVVDVEMPCSGCGDAEENWICLTCFEVHCGRFRPGQHMLGHYRRNPTHHIAASFSDLSVWCYSCVHEGNQGCYIEMNETQPHVERLAAAKFGEQHPPPEVTSAKNGLKQLEVSNPSGFFDVKFDSSAPMAAHKWSEQPEVFKWIQCRPSGCGTELGNYSIFGESDRATKKSVVAKVLSKKYSNQCEDRKFGSFLGMVIGDSLGAPMEFRPIRYDWDEDDIQVKDMTYDIKSRFSVKPGQWTDDSSMGLCIADSLLVTNKFTPMDLKMRFVLWWECGYNNAFGRDNDRLRKTSIGLGGNISQSFDEFMKVGYAFTKKGDENTSGNGSLMRNAAIPIFYFNSPDEAQEVARLQSLTTHQGIEASELCRLLTAIVIKCASHESDPETIKKDVLGNIDKFFKSDTKSVMHLARSEQETPTEGKDWDLGERNWNWKRANHEFAPQRAEKQPDYIGSYAMDNMAMSLHIVWSTSSFQEAVLKAANQCGDADTVAAVTGQIAGSIYGLSAMSESWITPILKWDNEGDIFLRVQKVCFIFKKSVNE